MRPNILYIHGHDTGRYVQPYGHAVATPNLQKLAEEGVLFRKAFCAAPTCSPSRSALLTGQAPHSAGMVGLVNRGYDLSDHSQHIVTTLRGAGYHTVLSGLQHVARDPKDIGYDEIRTTSGRAGASHAIEFLNDAPRAPFFLEVGFFENHRVFPEPTVDERYCMPPAPLPDTPKTRQDIAAYKTMAQDLDAKMGAVFAALDRNGLADNTLVICTTDHGLAFPGMKCNLTDHGMGVMLIMRGPGGFRGGAVHDAMLSQIDVFPTLCDLLDIDRPDWLQGQSFLPIVRGESDEVNEEVLAEVTYHAAYEPKRAVRTQRWKYIRHFGGRDRPVLPNCADSPSKEVWLDAGWQQQRVEAERLYALAFDPNETRNRVDDPDAADVLDDMRGRLDRWMERTDDPLLGGAHVYPPAGTSYNDPDGLSPNEKPTVVSD